MRSDKAFTSMKAKEESVTRFILENGFLSAYNPVEVSDPSWQVRGVDLSCTFNNKPITIDLKLKNSGFGNSPVEPSPRWSVEIVKQTYNGHIDGWFADKSQVTNIYAFLDAAGDSFSDLTEVSATMFSKASMANLIEHDTKLTIDQIKQKADDLLDEPYKRWVKLSDTFGLYKSSPDGKDREVVNCVFDRGAIDCISKKIVVRRKHK